MDLIFSRGVVHIADSDFLGDRHASGHELSTTLKENGPQFKHRSTYCFI